MYVLHEIADFIILLPIDGLRGGVYGVLVQHDGHQEQQTLQPIARRNI